MYIFLCEIFKSSANRGGDIVFLLSYKGYLYIRDAGPLRYINIDKYISLLYYIRYVAFKEE